MNTLDSRFCRDGDSFGQKFSQPGKYIYDFNLPGLDQLNKEGARFSINVSGADKDKKESKQHFVTVRYREKHFEADPPQLEIAAGDFVMWSSDDAGTPGFSISGHSDKNRFSSAAMEQEAVYTHAFGLPGEIEWGDANGKGASGKVIVRMPPTKSEKEMDAFKEVLKKGTVVVIGADKASPAQVEIYVGQTVFFAVEKAAGITITDRRLNVDISDPAK
ncbi:MAG TPA: hypothetical protein VLL54_09230 [Pyrinomonadaceae bacterium]|nr:hypothetical protein [Pyrinomonadaceae bacterium]